MSLNLQKRKFAAKKKIGKRKELIWKNINSCNVVLNQYLSSPNYFHRHFSWTGYVVRNSKKKVLMYCLDWNVHINVFILSGFSLKMPGYNINISISIQVINTWQMVINEVFLERLPKMMLTQPQLPSTVMYNGRKDILNGICHSMRLAWTHRSIQG